MAKDQSNTPNKDNKQKSGIIKNDIVLEMRTSYLDYAMSVIVSRALPDVRDGLKPVHRRVLYVMHESGLTHGAKFRKSATVVGDALGRYHPHNPDAVYDSMVRMAQDFSLRYPLVDGQGNFGSIDGDPPAAYRYTEARMTAMAEQILKDIEKDTVDFVPNYDNTREEPRVLPATFPQLIVNGTLGIAVGMATNIPPHNLREVIDATVHVIDNPSATSGDLMEFVKGPDFPTGGVIFNKKDINHAYSTGRGGVVMRGEADIVETKGVFQIIVNSIPYQVNKADLIIRIADLVREKRIEGIKDIRDESDRDGLRIVIDLKTGANPQNILNNLYKKTDIERTFHFNMIALIDGIQPQRLSLAEILTYFIEHRRNVVERRTKFDLAKAEARAHILEGLVKALDHIDAIIKTIKASKDRDAAHTALMKQFGFSELQANAILELRLQALAGLERQKIDNELKEKKALIKDLKTILGSAQKLMGVVKQELIDVKDKFGDERKTKVIARAAESLSYEDLVPEEGAVMIITRGGYIKRVSPEAYRTQHRGGKGVMDMNTKEEDFITILANGETHDDTLFFTDKGKVYQEKFYTIPEGKRTTRGKSIVNFLPLATDEIVTSVLIMPKSDKDNPHSLILVTKNGIIKKIDATAFEGVRKSGIIAMTLEKDDELLFARSVTSGDRIVVATKKGQSIYFDEKDVRRMGRVAGGVRAIKLNAGDAVVGTDVVTKGKEGEHYLLTMTAKGYGKRTSMKQYRVQKRSGSGIKTAQVTSKTGDVMASQVLDPDHTEVIVMSEKGQVIRIETKQIPTLGRATQGVRIIKLKSGDTLATLTCF